MYYSKDFLKRLDLERNKTIYGRITALQFNEQPIQAIEGLITGGSISIDGASVLRRTCSVTMVAQDVDISGYYWGLNTKFKLEIGVKNTIDENYPDIIWFKQGIFIITQFSTALSTTNYTINIQGKDKMCLLNGDVGGSLNATTRFDMWEQILSNGQSVETKYPIKKIIQDAVHQFAGEPYSNIIINDLEETCIQLLTYCYDKPLFLFRESNSDEYIMGTLDSDMSLQRLDSSAGSWSTTTLGAEDNKFDSLVDSLIEGDSPTLFRAEEQSGKTYHAARISYGDTAGYRLTDLEYPDELTGAVGESITSILDKIKTLLVQFEYFYDLDGRFVFQKKRDYLNTVWTPAMTDEDGSTYVEGGAYSTSTTYSFIGNELIAAFNNSPNLNNLRNDYSVWGVRKNASGSESVVHMRYAIDEKPIYYKNFDGIEYCTNKEYCDSKGQTQTTYYTVWQEIIYQMQKDYRKYNRTDDFEIKIIANNPPITSIGFSGYLTGQTGYEQYYIDLEGYWRQLYFPKYDYRNFNEEIDKKTEEMETVKNDTTKTEEEIQEEYDKLKQERDDLLTKQKEYKENMSNTYYESGDHINWNKNVFEAPEQLNYWIDFLDADGELNQFSCKAIGCRPKAVNDSKVKSIYFRETPAIIFASQSQMELSIKDSGYRYFQVSDFNSMFSNSTQGKSAKEVIDELLYQHSYCIESATITAIPVYYLEPNTRIYVYDKTSGISGDYILSKITIPLTYNGTMSLTATKAAERII